MSIASIDSARIERDRLEVPNRYLADKLPPAERAAYEAQYCENPVVLRELEATARLKYGLAKLRESGELQALLRPTPWHENRFVRIAAAVAILFVGALIARFATTESAPPMLAASIHALTDSHGSVLTVGSTAMVMRTRSESYDATVELPAPMQAIELRVFPNTVSSSRRYEATLFRVRADKSREPMSSTGNLVEGSNGSLSVFVDGSRLPAGDYQLDVRAEAAGGALPATDAFLIRVIPHRP